MCCCADTPLGTASSVPANSAPWETCCLRAVRLLLHCFPLQLYYAADIAVLALCHIVVGILASGIPICVHQVRDIDVCCPLCSTCLDTYLALICLWRT